MSRAKTVKSRPPTAKVLCNGTHGNLIAVLNRSAIDRLTAGGGGPWFMLLRDKRGVILRPLFVEKREFVTMVKLTEPRSGQPRISLTESGLDVGYHDVVWDSEEGQARLVPSVKKK